MGVVLNSPALAAAQPSPQYHRTYKYKHPVRRVMTKNKGNTKGRQEATQQRAVKTTTMSLTADERRFLQDSMKKKAATNDKYETAKSALEVTRSLTMSMVTAGVVTPEAATTIVGSAKDVAAKAKKKRRKSRRSDSDTSSDSSEESSALRLELTKQTQAMKSLREQVHALTESNSQLAQEGTRDP